MLNKIKVAENFSLHEFQCHCGAVKLCPALVDKLQQLRNALNRPIVITSGYRCEEHNRAVGGAQRSQHLLGRAADIRVAGLTPEEVAGVAEAVGFKGIGIYPTFTHVDVREGPQARWKEE